MTSFHVLSRTLSPSFIIFKNAKSLELSPILLVNNFAILLLYHCMIIMYRYERKTIGFKFNVSMLNRLLKIYKNSRRLLLLHPVGLALIFSRSYLQCESKTSPPATCGFLTFFRRRLRILNQFSFLHTYYTFLSTLDYKFFIKLSQILTKLCHIKRDYQVHIICSKCPPSAETHAFRSLRKSLIALLIVVCGKTSQICCFYNANKHAGYDMTSTTTSFAQ